MMEIVKKYQVLRPKNTTVDHMFLNYQKGKCTTVPMGRKKIGGMPKEIATWLELPNPEKYTGHAFHRTGVTLLSNTGGRILDLKLLGGWLSDKVAGECVENSLLNKEKIGNLTMSSIDVAEFNEASSSSTSVEKCCSPLAKRFKGNSSEISTVKTRNSSSGKALYFQNCQVRMNYE